MCFAHGVFGGNEGALNPHPASRADQVALRSLRSLLIKVLWVTGNLNMGHTPEISPNRKPSAFALGFLFGGNEGALNPHPASRADQVALRSLRSLLIKVLWVTTNLNMGLTPEVSPNRKPSAFALGFLFGGNEGARTHDLTDVNRAL